MKFATALLIAGMFVGISAHADDGAAPCLNRTNQEFQHNEAADTNLIDRISGNIQTPKSNPPPASSTTGAVRDGN